MVKPNKNKVLKNLEAALSRIILDGLVWEKRVSKGSGCGLICVPETLVGKRLKVILIPIDLDESLRVQKEIAINNDNMRNHNAQITKLANKKKKLEETIAIETPKDSLDENLAEELEDKDAF